jgi:hypothetical protein
MRATILLACALLCGGPTTSAGQSIVLQGSGADLDLGQTVNWAVRLEGGRRGFLLYVVAVDAFLVVVPHPTKSGPQGRIPVGGLCRELLFRPLPTEPWAQPHGPHPYDADHDGDDDLVVQSMIWPYRWVVINLDVAACR